MKVYLWAKTGLSWGFYEYFKDINQTDWTGSPDGTTFVGSMEPDLLVEAAGRMCYRSWAPYDGTSSTNPNVKRVRQGGQRYLANILKSGHGSVLEHVNLTFLLTGVSRVLTHELVRHRAGCAYSQESGRYVRIDNLEVVMPELENEEASGVMSKIIGGIQTAITTLNNLLINDDMSFHDVKQATSLIRRIAPIGVSTNIVFTANARALRHIIAMRTSEGAEVELRKVFGKVAEICKKECPHIFQDMEKNEGGEYVFASSKV